MSKLSKQQTMALASMAAVMVFFCALPAQAAIIATKASTDFGLYQYEMDVKPSTQNLDANGSLDFSTAGASTVSGGILNYSTLFATNMNYNSNATNRAWRVLAPTLATGYTIEARLRVNSQDDAVFGAFSLSSAASDSDADAHLYIGTDFVKWGRNPNEAAVVTLQSGTSNTDFNVFRIAMKEGQTAGSEVFHVWRNGVLLSDTVTDGLGNNGLYRLFFGDGSNGRIGGDVDIDYLRFTSGAFAPIPEPSSLLLAGLGLLGSVCLRRRR